MRARIKNPGIFGDRKIEDYASIDEILVKEDLLFPEKARIHLFFKGKNTSGIITFSRAEMEKIVGSTNNKGILVKNKKS